MKAAERKAYMAKWAKELRAPTLLKMASHEAHGEVDEAASEVVTVGTLVVAYGG